jgi:hypothetical protein
MMSITLALLLFGTVPTDAELQRLRDLEAAAAREIVRLEPSSLPHLPRPIAEWMVGEGFTIPQSFCATGPHNVVSGHLDEDGSLDWAVLCSRADTSRIVVFWGGSADSTTALHPILDASFLQGIGGDAMGYSRFLLLETPERIRSRYKAWDATVPEWVTHDAIEDYFCEKGSRVVYWRNGVQEMLLGAD